MIFQTDSQQVSLFFVVDNSIFLVNNLNSDLTKVKCLDESIDSSFYFWSQQPSARGYFIS